MTYDTQRREIAGTEGIAPDKVDATNGDAIGIYTGDGNVILGKVIDNNPAEIEDCETTIRFAAKTAYNVTTDGLEENEEKIAEGDPPIPTPVWMDMRGLTIGELPETEGYQLLEHASVLDSGGFKHFIGWDETRVLAAVTGDIVEAKEVVSAAEQSAQTGVDND
jgi:hypothetical protein